MHIVGERKLSPYSNLDFNLDVFIDINKIETQESLYIYLYVNFSSSVFLAL